MGNYIRQTIQGEQEPVCTHCRGTDLKKDGRRNGRQKYECRTCGRISYGLPPDLRPRCPWCRGAVRETRLSDGRLQYLCPACKKKFLSEYEQARHERGTVRRYRHIVNFYLNTRARLALVEYAQATRLTEPQALRAILRYVLTGNVFWTFAGIRPGRACPVPRDPATAAIRLPDLRPEALEKQLALRRQHSGNTFPHTVIVVQKFTVALDDEAKEGLLFAMGRLEMNHADAVRWLLANVRMPDGLHRDSYVRALMPEPPQVVTGGSRRSVIHRPGRDSRWED